MTQWNLSYSLCSCSVNVTVFVGGTFDLFNVRVTTPLDCIEPIFKRYKNDDLVGTCKGANILE